MEKRVILFILVLYVLTITGVYHRADGALDKYLIIPGKSVGLIELGKPIPKSVMKELGKPTNFTKPVKGKDGIDTGNYYWENNLNIKLNDGLGDFNVYQIFVINTKYHTEKRIKVGSKAAEAKKAYPGGEKVDVMDCDYGWEITGMTLFINNNKVCGISVHPESYGSRP